MYQKIKICEKLVLIKHQIDWISMLHSTWIIFNGFDLSTCAEHGLKAGLVLHGNLIAMIKQWVEDVSKRVLGLSLEKAKKLKGFRVSEKKNSNFCSKLTEPLGQHPNILLRWKDEMLAKAISHSPQ